MQFLEFLNKPILTFFQFIHGGIATVFTNPNISWGLAVIVFTIIIRIILLPLNIKQTRSQIKMQAVQPLVQELQNKYKGDPQKIQQETMKLYKEHDASPFSGCLPLLIQWPVFLAMFFAFNTANFNHASFLWVKDLGLKDQFYILPVLSAITTYISSSLMMAKNNGTQAKQPGGMNTQTMNISMAVVFGFMSLNFKSALVLYWVVNNLIQMGQTIVMKRMSDNKIQVVDLKNTESNKKEKIDLKKKDNNKKAR